MSSENPDVVTVVDGVQQISDLITQIESHHAKMNLSMYVSIAMVVLTIGLSVLRLVSADPVTIAVVPSTPSASELVPGRMPRHNIPLPQSVPPQSVAPQSVPPQSDPSPVVVPAPLPEGTQ